MVAQQKKKGEKDKLRRLFIPVEFHRRLKIAKAKAAPKKVRIEDITLHLIKNGYEHFQLNAGIVFERHRSKLKAGEKGRGEETYILIKVPGHLHGEFKQLKEDINAGAWEKEEGVIGISDLLLTFLYKGMELEKGFPK